MGWCNPNIWSRKRKNTVADQIAAADLGDDVTIRLALTTTYRPSRCCGLVSPMTAAQCPLWRHPSVPKDLLRDYSLVLKGSGTSCTAVQRCPQWPSLAIYCCLMLGWLTIRSVAKASYEGAALGGDDLPAGSQKLELHIMCGMYCIEPLGWYI